MKVASGSCVARYYDPRTSVWQSVDPILDRYLDSGVNNGVYNSINLGAYSYAALTPLKYVDPTGLFYEGPESDQDIFKKNNPDTLDARSTDGKTGKTDTRNPSSNASRNIPKPSAGAAKGLRLLKGITPPGLILEGLWPKEMGDATSKAGDKPFQGHHLINQAQLNGKNPHPMAKIAKQAGVDIKTAKWNIEDMRHQGGHTKDYYNAVRKKLDVVFESYRESGANWNATRIESEMKGVAQQISREIKSGDLKLYKK